VGGGKSLEGTDWRTVATVHREESWRGQSTELIQMRKRKNLLKNIKGGNYINVGGSWSGLSSTFFRERRTTK